MRICACSMRSLTLLLLLSSKTALAQTPPVIEPEKTTTVLVSNRDVNRIHCGSPIQDVFYSTEKPVEITPEGHNVFVKFKVRREGDKETRVSVPVDLHVVCDNQVYTLILQPTDGEATTLRLGSPQSKAIAATLKEWGAIPLEDKIKRFTLAVFRDEIPASFTRKPLADDRRDTRVFKNIAVRGVQRVSAPGLGLAAVEFEVVAFSEVTLDERDFLTTSISSDVVAITIDPLVLPDPVHGKKARVIVIERSMNDGRE